ncbi:hypothetical protein ACYJ80_06655 [Staphylococcus capitis]|jgi:hypothetical protein|uniref:hypothetical protein n=1 Tax=Staphylococcus TaxID=1279 RepID=UPI0003BE4C0A|nr:MULTISPECIES: hypothetical protein [Staphylococcus]DAM78077.1 MAG TPA: lipoprotein [Caudoviricetes sp.]ATN03191.1 hypothetical protein CRN29_08255 [Staphylococcus capitis]MBF0712543.1 hypothetical protein [Staphylococcus capitis]MBF2239256.1 hypothetical protein [Staphylococcus capitis]MBF2242482.1 hypothetical protein [Staphylococcus capitis]
MRYFKSIKRVLIPISICTLVILLIGCGKSSDGLAGREFKGVVDGKTDAIFTFKDDGTFKVVSAQGKPNAGEEFTGKYEVKEENSKKYLILSYFSKYIFGSDIKNKEYVVVDGKNSYVYELEKDGDNYKLEAPKEEKLKNDVRLISDDN